jgi:hypothetical protein
MEKDYNIPKNAKKVKPEAKQYLDAYNESNKMYDKLHNEFINLPVGNKEFNDCIEKAYNDCISHKLNRNSKPEEKKSFIEYFDKLKKSYIENSEIYDDLWNRYVKAREVGCGWGEAILHSVMNGMMAFCTVYSLGMTAYGCYQELCYLNGLTPANTIGNQCSEIPISHETPNNPLENITYT